MEAASSDEERAGRRHRLRIILGVAVALVVAWGSFGFYVDRRADDAQADLRRRLEQASTTVEHDAVLAWYRSLGDPNAPLLPDDLLPAGDLVALRAEGETVVAVYKAGFAGQDRCFDFRVGPDGTDVEERSC